MVLELRFEHIKGTDNSMEDYLSRQIYLSKYYTNQFSMMQKMDFQC